MLVNVGENGLHGEAALRIPLLHGDHFMEQAIPVWTPLLVKPGQTLSHVGMLRQDEQE